MLVNLDRVQRTSSLRTMIQPLGIRKTRWLKPQGRRKTANRCLFFRDHRLICTILSDSVLMSMLTGDWREAKCFCSYDQNKCHAARANLSACQTSNGLPLGYVIYCFHYGWWWKNQMKWLNLQLNSSCHSGEKSLWFLLYIIAVSKTQLTTQLRTTELWQVFDKSVGSLIP